MTPRNPFPGMNPYLEGDWPDVHSVLNSEIRTALSGFLPQDLYARAEESVLIDDDHSSKYHYRADVAVTESWRSGIAPAWNPAAETSNGGIVAAEPILVQLDEPVDRWVEVREAGGRLVTVIEVLSVGNKTREGRERYLQKANNYRHAGISVVEIDLLRGGIPVLAPEYLDNLRPSGCYRYYISVSRGWKEPNMREIYPCPLRERIPVIRLPLRSTDKDIALDLQPLIDRCYVNGRYWLTATGEVPGPPLHATDAAWVKEQMAAAAG